MATQAPDELESSIIKLAQMNVSSLMTRPSDWGPFTFESARGDLEAIREIAQVVSGLDLSKLPAFARPQMKQAFLHALTAVNQINNFNVAHNPNPTSQHGSYISEVAAALQDLQQNAHAWIPYIAYMHGDLPSKLAQIADAVSSATENTAGFRQAIDERLKELDATISATREAAADAGVTHFALDFDTDATHRDDEARTWLVASASLGIVALAAAGASFLIAFPTDPVQAVQYATSKVVILALLIGATAWCAGNFKANKHQAVISRRKAHALKTFQAFVQASDNPAIRDAVLIETTRSIFSQSHTGYIKADGSADSASHVVEIIKSNASRPE